MKLRKRKKNGISKFSCKDYVIQEGLCAVSFMPEPFHILDFPQQRMQKSGVRILWENEQCK
jgi:hypothetical protein